MISRLFLRPIEHGNNGNRVTQKIVMMDKTAKEQKLEKVMTQILNKAWNDEQFKQNLVNNPEATLVEYLGRSFESDSKIVVLDKSNPDHVYITIPPKPSLEDMELNEEQLEMVSGGSDEVPSPWPVIGYVITHPIEAGKGLYNFISGII